MAKKENRERTSKKEIVLGGGKSKRKSGLFAALAVLLSSALTLVIVFSGGQRVKTVSAESGVVSIPLSEVSDGKAHFYEYNFYAYKGDRRINFFLLKSDDGVLRAAFDACDVCFRQKKGYRQEEDFMVCNNCGQSFPAARINVLRGGCNPAPLDRQVDGRFVTIRAEDLNQGSMYF